MVRQVQPLRISKTTTPSSSPSKMPAATSRPLSEIGSTERRRNSPSYNQATKKAIVSRESSPYTENSSPQSNVKSSPRDFWFTRENMSPSRFDTENSPAPEASPTLSSPKRRPSVERLMQASRVKNSNIFALETKDAYDPSTLPIVERPVANRPLSKSLANNNFTRLDSQRKENSPLRAGQKFGHKRSESQTDLPTLTPTKSPAAAVSLPASPEKLNQSSPSPTKSSLARSSQFGVPAIDTDKFDGERAPTPRQSKSVTFHADPPVVNEYEEQTPEPSLSLASDREGSWDSEDFDDQDISFERGSSLEVPEREDSFDADLENADKTPVVLPEDWSRMSPDEARTDLVNADDDVFDEGEPTERGLPALTGRAASDGETRPLPPLPAFMQRERSGSDSLTSAAQRAANATRGIYSPPKAASCSKDEILQMVSKTSLTTQERTAPVAENSDTPSSKPSGMINEAALNPVTFNTGDRVEVQVQEKEVGEDSIVGDLSEFTKSPPRISRESILRKVRNSKYDFEDFEDDDDVDEPESTTTGGTTTRPSIAELAKMDPDQPIPSRENSRETSDNFHNVPLDTSHVDDSEMVEIKEESVEEQGFDMNSIPAATDEQQKDEAPRSPSRMEDYDRQSSVLRHGRALTEDEDEDEEHSSRYSSTEPDAECSMIHYRQETVEHDNGKETLHDAMQLLTVKDYSNDAKEPTKQGGFLSGDFLGLPAYLSTDDFDFGMKDFITPPPAETASSSSFDVEVKEVKKMETFNVTTRMSNGDMERDVVSPPAPAPAPAEYVEREVSPPTSSDSAPPHDDGPISPIEEPMVSFEQHTVQRQDVIVPDRVSSIKTPGGKLKARPSATPADLAAMAEQRRTMSVEPTMPSSDDAAAISNEVDSSANSTDDKIESNNEEVAKSPQKDRRKSRKSGGRMDLSFLDASTFTIGDEEEDGLRLDEDFDRVIEAQKVREAPFPPPSFARFDATLQQQRDLPALPQGYASCDSFVTPYSPHTSSAGANVSSRTQKGYLMRQNTKVVVASNRTVSGESSDTAKSTSTMTSEQSAAPSIAGQVRPSSRGTKSANSSPRKPSQEQFLKTEPWNGKIRRQSLRIASTQKEVMGSDVAPPLPGQESALATVTEDSAAGSAVMEEFVGEGVERGRLFVKVVGVKDLDLPMPKNDRLYFQLTLDNGLHCVTTSSLELGTNAPIGQEFELVVLNDLEFQLTLSTKLPPPPQPTPPSSSGSMSGSPTKSPVKNQKGFSRFLSSPKKRAEKERQEREAAEAEEKRLQEEARKKRISTTPTVWDHLRELVNASDGSFARAYVNLSTHEKQCFGRQLSVDVPCYNEWALENDAQVVNSVRSKRGTNGGPVRRPPYVVGNLQLQLFYVPKPKGEVKEEDMPKSMSAAVREMKRAGEVGEVGYEGHLSQQGGDCTHWRRRYFRLQGTKLTAYHEHTHQKRAVINLSKASRLVDDKRMLTADHSPTKSHKGRRKSAFAEEDEAYQYVEEGFRMRFANGETIDFYADNIARKDEWMAVLSQVIGKPDASQKSQTWTDIVLARERAQARPDSAGSNGNAASRPTSPVKAGANASSRPASPVKAGANASSRPTSPVKAGAQQQEPSEIKDFGRPGSRQQQQQQQQQAGSKSVPTSPVKPSSREGALPPPATAASKAPEMTVGRPTTPPMSPRKGGRARSAVKSMIF